MCFELCKISVMYMSRDQNIEKILFNLIIPQAWYNKLWYPIAAIKLANETLELDIFPIAMIQFLIKRDMLGGIELDIPLPTDLNHHNNKIIIYI